VVTNYFGKENFVLGMGRLHMHTWVLGVFLNFGLGGKEDLFSLFAMSSHMFPQIIYVFPKFPLMCPPSKVPYGFSMAFP